MATSGIKIAGTGSSVARSTATAWTSPGNITANDGTTASISSGSIGSAYLVGSNFGFAIPAGSVINGVTVIWDVAESATGTEAVTVQLQSDSATLIGATRSFTANGATLTQYTTGGAADLWGATLTPTLVNSANFGVRMWFLTTHAMTVDYVSVEITYTPPATGTLASTETGSDTFTATGDVMVKGNLISTETGLDTFSATGSLSTAITGALDATETGNDTFASTGKVVVKGALSVSETGADAFDSQGSTIPGDLVGDLHATESGSDTLASSGKVVVKGSLAVNETADTFAATGKVTVQGALSAAETGSDTMDSQGSTVAGDTVGDLHGFEENDTISASGKVIVKGGLASSETGADHTDIFGHVFVQGSASLQETGADAISSSGKVLVKGSLAGTETGSDTFYAAEADVVIGSLNASETGQDTARFEGARPVVDTGGGRKNYFRPVREVTVRVGVSQKLVANTRAVKVNVTSRAVALGWAPGATIKTRPVRIYRSVQPEVNGRVSGGTRSVLVATDFNLKALPVTMGFMGHTSSVNVTTTTAQIVLAKTPSAKFGSSPARVKAVINPTDDELFAIAAALKQARMKQMQSIVSKFRR